MTKAAFLQELRKQLMARYSWAADDAKLDRFMVGVRTTLTTSATIWHHVGEATTAAWRAIGGAGTPSLKALRELRDEEDKK